MLFHRRNPCPAALAAIPAPDHLFFTNIETKMTARTGSLHPVYCDGRFGGYLSIIATKLKDITSSMTKKMYQFNFTPTEVEVASLINEGMATKEIAKIMGIAASSVNTHRNNIRKKLGISNEDVNLRAHLQSLD